MTTPIITFTSDFGTKDYFVGAFKGRIYGALNKVNLVDITHGIAPFSITEAAYVITNAYKHFPKGTIHIIAVDAEWSIENKHLVVLLNGHYFICADNGILSILLTNSRPDNVVEIDLPTKNESYFMANFVNAATHLAKGKEMSSIGKSITEIAKIKEMQPIFKPEANQLIGNIIYIDNFGNVISNIDFETFEAARKGRNYEIKIRRYSFNMLNINYNDIVNYNVPVNERKDDGKALALFNSDNLLEIAIYRSNLDTVGGASSLLGVKYRDTITISFS
ncbi:MAG: SAM-dependent chlorinase/fluorinase [Flavobacteriaceae bacterium]